MGSSLSNKLRLYKDKLYSKNVKYPFDRLRVYTFVVTSLLIIIGGTLHFFGILGIKRPALLTISFCWILVIGVLLVLFLSCRMKLVTAFVSSAIASQAVETARLLYLSITHTMSIQQLYLNEFVCISILLMAIMGFFYIEALCLTFANLMTIFVCGWLAPDIVNSMTICFLILLDVGLCSYCFASVEFVKHISMENEEVRGKYNSFLSFLRMNDKEASSLLQLVRTAPEDEAHVESLVGQLRDETKSNLINVGKKIENSYAAKEEKIKEFFPYLSPTELRVCHLVMAGYSQKEIARIMNKSEKNVSTVRGNIRRKLNLETSQDLRQYLVETVK